MGMVVGLTLQITVLVFVLHGIKKTMEGVQQMKKIITTSP